MKNAVAFLPSLIALALLCACTREPGRTVDACDQVLIGVWRSDKARTMDFNRANARLTPKQEVFLEAIMGKMTQRFDGKSVRLRMPDIEMQIDGKTTLFHGFEERASYDVAFCDARTVVLKTTDAKTNQIRASVYHVVDRDTLWVYGGSNDPAIPDLHVREYLKRLR